MSIVAQLLALFGPILTKFLADWLESLFRSVERDGMSGVDVIDAAIATMPSWSIRPRTWRRKALLARMRATAVDRPSLSVPLTRSEEKELMGYVRPVLADLAA